MMRRLIGRISLALLAAAACAWFIVGIRQTHALASANALIGGSRISAGQAQHARSLLDTAGWLNPDSEVDLLRAKLDVEQECYAAARRVIYAVLRSEPENARAWLALGHASQGDPKAFFAAVLELRKLVPRVR